MAQDNGATMPAKPSIMGRLLKSGITPVLSTTHTSQTPLGINGMKCRVSSSLAHGTAVCSVRMAEECMAARIVIVKLAKQHHQPAVSVSHQHRQHPKHWPLFIGCNGGDVDVLLQMRHGRWDQSGNQDEVAGGKAHGSQLQSSSGRPDVLAMQQTPAVTHAPGTQMPQTDLQKEAANLLPFAYDRCGLYMTECL